MPKAVILFIALTLLAGCMSTTRSSIPRQESHYAQTVAHRLERGLAFRRVEGALGKAYENLPEVLKQRQPESGTIAVESTVSYRVGGAMGTDQKAKYTLKVVVREATVDLAFELGPDVSDGTWPPESEIPYIRHEFAAIVTRVEEAVATP